jgi:glycosyltransferase involved in cell wall biosynthesis
VTTNDVLAQDAAEVPTSTESTGRTDVRPDLATSSVVRPLRILEVAPRFLPELGGVETHTLEISRRLSARGDLEVTVFGSDRSGKLPQQETSEGFDIIRRQSWPRHRDYYVSPGLVRVITDGGWDVVHFQSIHTLIPILGMATARRARIPYLLTFHTGGNSSPVRSALRGTQWKVLTPLLRSAFRLVAVSRFERALFERYTGLDDSHFAVIRNGGSLPTPPAGSEMVAGRIVSSGRLEKYKGHHRVIEALPAIRVSLPEAHLVILGSGPYEPELKALATRLGVADAVTIRHVPGGDREAMAGELAGAAVFAALSDYEAHPVAVMEALALGVPVLGFDVAGTADLVEDGLVVGVDPGSSAAIVSEQLVGALRRATAERAAPTGLPTWEQSAAALAELYLQAADRSPASR